MMKGQSGNLLVAKTRRFKMGDPNIQPMVTKKDAIKKISLLLIAFIIPFFIVSYFPFDLPNKFFFSLQIGAMSSTLLFVLIFSKNNRVISFKLNSNLIFTLIYLLSIIITAFQNFSITPIAVISVGPSLSQIGAIIPSVLLTFFLPGYALFSFLKIKNSFLENLSYSILLSIFMTSLIGFIAWNLGSIPQFASTITIIINLVILLGFLFSRSNTLRHSELYTMRLDVGQLIVTFLVLSFCFSSYFTIHDITSPLPLLGDELDHVGTTIKFLNNYSTWQENVLSVFSTSAYPYFFHLFEAVGIQLSKLPVTIYYLLSSLILLPLPLLTFIPLAKSLTNGNRIITALSTVLFQVFSGFGWIYSVLNYTTTNQIGNIVSSAAKTGDIIYSTWFPTITAPYLLDLAVLLFALNLALNKEINSKKYVVMLIPLLLLGLLAHFEKILFLSGIILLLAIVQLIFHSKKFNTKGLSIALITSCVLGLFMDMFAAKSLLTSLLLLPILLVIGMNIFTLFISWSIPKFNFVKLKQIFTSNTQIILLFITLAFVLVSIMELLLQVKALGDYMVVPFYFLPIKFGVAGIFVLVWLVSLSKDNINKNGALLFLLSAVFLLEILIYHGPFPLYSYTGMNINEFRFIRDLLWPVIAIASSVGIFIIIKKVLKLGLDHKMALRSFANMAFCVVLIGIMIVAGSFSNLLKVDYMMVTASVDDANLGVVRFMANQSVPTGSSLYAPSSLYAVIHSVTGVVIYTPDSTFYGSLLSTSNDVSSILFTLDYLNVSYVVISKSDGSYLKQLLQYYPLLYSDNSYVVYRLTSLSPPSLSSDTLLLASNVQPAETIFSYGFDGAIQWTADFDNVSLWQPDNSSFTNVNNYSANSADSILTIQANGDSGSKTVLFYKHVLSDPITVETGSSFFVKFKTQIGTRFIVQVLYDDGSSNNAFYKNDVYMNSSDWALSMTGLQAGKKIVGFEIGITNKFNESIADISANIDYMGIFKTSRSTHYQDAVTSLSLAGVNYTIAYQLESLNSNNFSSIVIIDEDYYSNATLNKLLELAQKGCNVIVLGNLSTNGLASNFANITQTEKVLSASQIQTSITTSCSIPLTTVPVVSLSNCAVLVSYSDGAESAPLLVKFNVGEKGCLYYFNLWPLLDSSKDLDSVSSRNVQTVLSVIYGGALGLSYSSVDDRLFYLKNNGSIKMDGNINITISNLILPEKVSVTHYMQGSQYLLNVVGSSELRVYDSGYILLVVNGTMSLLENGVVIYKSTVSEMSSLAKISQITGYAQVELSSLTSAYPYKVSYSNAKYDYSGNFEFGITPLTNDLFFIYPYNLGELKK